MEIPLGARPASLGPYSGVAAGWLVVLYLAASPIPLFAQTEFSWSAGLGVSHSNNINREEDGELSENTFSVDGGLEWRRRSDRLNAQVDANVLVTEFANNTFATEVRGNMVADLDFALVGDSLRWRVQDTFGQLRIDNFAPDTPANRENVNLLRTGPVLVRQLGRRSSLLAQVYYESTYFEESAEDGDTIGGSFSFERRLGQRTLASLNALARRVEFDERALFSSFDAQEVYLGWDVEGARTRVQIEAGVSALRDGGRTDDSALFRLQIDRRLSRFGTLALNARSELATTTDAFRYEQTSSRPGLATRPREVNADPFLLESVELSYTLDGRRLQSELLVQFEQERFERSLQDDRDRKAARLTVGGPIGPTWSAELEIAFADESLRDRTRDIRDLLLGASLLKRFSNNISVRLGVAHLDRSAADPTLRFNELVVQLSMAYQNRRVRNREGGAERR